MYVGLCGVMDRDKTNDYTKADGSIYVHADADNKFPNEFTRTWRYGLVHPKSGIVGSIL